MTLGYVTALRNRQLDQITAELGANALLRIYSGTRPATGGTETTLLAELVCASTFAPAAVGGVLTPNAITADSSANAAGNATWFRLLTSGAVPKLDGDVGTSGSDLNLNNIAIAVGSTVAVASFTITMGNP